MGVIVYYFKDFGLVVVDKNMVVILVLDVMLNFVVFFMEIFGEVVFLYFMYNYVLVVYNLIVLGEVGMVVV